MAYKYYAFTPGGTICLDTEADTPEEAMGKH